MGGEGEGRGGGKREEMEGGRVEEGRRKERGRRVGGRREGRGEGVFTGVSYVCYTTSPWLLRSW